MKNKDFITFPIHGWTNPIIVRRNRIESIVPNPNNQLESKLYLINSVGDDHVLINEPTSNIEGRL